MPMITALRTKVTRINKNLMLMHKKPSNRAGKSENRNIREVFLKLETYTIHSKRTGPILLRTRHSLVKWCFSRVSKHFH